MINYLRLVAEKVHISLIPVPTVTQGLVVRYDMINVRVVNKKGTSRDQAQLEVNTMGEMRLLIAD